MQTDKKENDERKPVILFADDDAICLDVGIKMLRKLGYKVLDARDGKEAIEVFLKNQSEVNLVILDMKMPYNGGNAFSQLKKINANVKVLIASGYAKDAYSDRFRPPIPDEAGHPFRLIPATDSGTSRPPIPDDSGHLI